MVSVLQQFIEKHIDLITENKWYQLYEIAIIEIPFQIGNLSTSLISAGINPMNNLIEILDYMFSNSMINEINIPENIVKICHQAFVDCYQLQKIVIPRSVRKITGTAFKGCYELKEILYEGTLEEMANIKPHLSLLDDCETTWITCSNGTYDVATGEVIPND